jgi:hypothetical protein
VSASCHQVDARSSTSPVGQLEMSADLLRCPWVQLSSQLRITGLNPLPPSLLRPLGTLLQMEQCGPCDCRVSLCVCVCVCVCVCG